MINSKYYPILLLFFIGIISCKNHHNTQNKDCHNYPISYAKGFTVYKAKDYVQIEIRNPWDTTHLLQRYILVNKHKQIPLDLPQGSIIRTPVEKVVAYSSTHCGMLESINESSTIKGVCESRYIDLPFIKEGVESGQILDLGESSSPEIEKIIELSPDIIITSPIQNMSYGRVSKLGIPIIEFADYMEQTPLGRTEWIRMLALLFEKEELGNSIFNKTASKYNLLKGKVLDTTHRPTLFAERKTGNVWYVPGGNSYMATLYKDAGAHYLWENDHTAGSLPLSFESVFEKAIHADYWLIKYNSNQDLSYYQLENEMNLYTQFDAFKHHDILVCNTGKVPYYEEMPLHPDRLLEDLIALLHPEVLPNHKTRYFKKLE